MARRNKLRTVTDRSLTWFAASATADGGPEVIGYVYAPARAEWFRWDGAEPAGPDGPRDLSAAYELTATDGHCHLRWTHRQSGTGPAVSLSEIPGLLPPGDPLPPGQARSRLNGTPARMLAGKVTESSDGWTTIRSARYAPAHVPVGDRAGLWGFIHHTARVRADCFIARTSLRQTHSCAGFDGLSAARLVSRKACSTGFDLRTATQRRQPVTRRGAVHYVIGFTSCAAAGLRIVRG